ncbi:MAG TPA: ATP synthase F1 subunit delta [Saprospiraceae bacterium]|nr:ATP synthase F1 subunit delta [Saprospiraceae bacterium]
MSVARIAFRYAKSLIDLASEQNKLDRVLEDMESFLHATKNRDFYLLLKSPIVNTTKKQAIFKELFKDKYDEMTFAFLNIILTKGREAFLPDIANDFITQYKKLSKITTVKLITAVPLGEAALEKIKAKLLDSAATQQKIELETVVNKDLIGGFVLEFDNQLYDASVAHKLEQLKKEFSKNHFVKAF